MNTKLKKTDWIVIIIVYAVTIVINSLDYYKEGNMLKEYVIDFSASILMSLSLVLLFMYWLIPNYLVDKQKYGHFVFLGLLSLFIIGSISYTAGFWSGDNDWARYPKGLDFVLRSIFHETDTAGMLLGILLTKKFYEGQKELAMVQKQQKENELKLLRSQLDPHFLFNNLNTLDALVDSDPDKAKEYINRLALIYRYLIQTKDAEVMELSKELEFAENYIFLIKTRFGEDYNFNIEKMTSLNEKFVPTGALQTLLENVVKHNKASHNSSIETSINIDQKRLEVTNTKSTGYPKNESFGTGLANLKSRYKLLTEEEIIILNKTSKYKVSIPIINLDV